MKILLTGSEGLLGKYLRRNICRPSDLITHSRNDFDLYNRDKLLNNYLHKQIDVILHCAAYTDVKQSDSEPRKVFVDNIVASNNLIDLAFQKSCRFVFISTDFVFDGTKGDYKTTDMINPQSLYAKSKASIELSLACLSKSLIIRTSFFGESFPFESGCIDRYTSKDYIDIIAPQIYEQAIGNRTGIVHIGTERKTFYDLGKRRKQISQNECLHGNLIGKDYSFNYED